MTSRHWDIWSVADKSLPVIVTSSLRLTLVAEVQATRTSVVRAGVLHTTLELLISVNTYLYKLLCNRLTKIPSNGFFYQISLNISGICMWSAFIENKITSWMCVYKYIYEACLFRRLIWQTRYLETLQMWSTLKCVLGYTHLNVYPFQ